MNDKDLIGTWRSYKTFYASGGEKKHSATSFMQLHYGNEGVLTIRPFPDSAKPAVVQTRNWDIRMENKRCFLYLLDKPAYEVLTLDKSDLVLADLHKGEKIFFAPLAEWQYRITPMKTPMETEGSITIWSKSLIQLIKP